MHAVNTNWTSSNCGVVCILYTKTSNAILRNKEFYSWLLIVEYSFLAKRMSHSSVHVVEIDQHLILVFKFRILKY